MPCDCQYPMGLYPNVDTTFRIGGGVTPTIGLATLAVLLVTAAVVYAYW